MNTEKKLIRRASLEKLINNLMAEGQKIFAPVSKENITDFEEISSLKEMAEDYITTVQSAKHIVFPKVEKLFGYETRKDGTKIIENDLKAIPNIVLLGA